MLRQWCVGALVAVVAAGAGCEDSPGGRAPLERGAPADWHIQPGVRAGSLNRSSSELDLAQAYGASALRDSTITFGEGMSAPGTILFPADPERRLEIVWADAAAKREPRRIALRGERSRWMLPGDLSLGSSLADLERANGRPFRLSGFGWDYSGAVVSWNGGALDSVFGTNVKLYLEPSVERRSGAAYRRAQGDREFNSSNPDMRSLDPRVDHIVVDLAPTSGRIP